MDQFNYELGDAAKLLRKTFAKARENGLKEFKHVYIPKYHEYSSLLMFLCMDYGLKYSLYEKDTITVE